jgi:hypothetical protein
VRTVLNDKECAQWSDREIARRLDVGHQLVAKLRDEAAETATGPETSEERTRKFRSKTGTVTTMRTAKIGRKTRKSTAPAQSATSNGGSDIDLGPSEPAVVQGDEGSMQSRFTSLQEFTKFIVARITPTDKAIAIPVSEADVQELQCLLGRAKLAI